MYDLIKKYEGCKLNAYLCPAGVWTIGWGSTMYPNGKSVREGDKITQSEADSLLEWYCNKKISIPAGLSNNQKDALYSLIYNIGQPAFDRSSLKKAIIAKDWKNVWKNWDWITAAGTFTRGLAKRRADELMTFFS